MGVIGHVEQPEAHLSQTTVADEEIAAFHDAFYQFVGNGLARLIVESKRAQKVFLHGIVFHELRGQLHKVPPHIGARKALEARVGKHAMERVSELVEESLHLAECEQGGFLVGGLGEIHHHAHVRPHIVALAVYPLPLKLGHPSPALLAFTRMEIGVEHGPIAAVLVEHLVGLHIGVVDGDVVIFLERDAVEPVGQSEHPVDHPVEPEVGAQHLRIEVVFLHLELVRVIPEVPRLELKVLALHFPGDGLHFFQLFLRCGFVGLKEVVEQFVDIAGIGCHAVLEHVVGIGVVA